MKSETPWILPRMIKTLGPYPVDFNPHLMVRVKAAAGLYRFGNYAGVPFLIKILKDNTPASDPEREWDQDPRLAWEKEEALMAMESLMGQASGFLIDAPLADQAEAALAMEAWWLSHRVDLWQKAPPLVDPLLCAKVRELVAGLGSFQARNADGARYCLKLLGPPVFPFLDEAIRKGAFYERFHALDILANLAPLAGDAAPVWARTAAFALGDKSPAVRAQAAHTLGCLHQAESLGPLEKALTDPDLDVRLSAVCALGHLYTEEAREILQALLDQDIPGQMAVEAKAALFHASPEFLDLFIQEFLDPDTQRQEWALQKLIDLTGEDGGFPVGAAPLEREQALPAVRVLLQVMKR